MSDQRQQIYGLTTKQLRAELLRQGISAAGNKSELLERLAAAHGSILKKQNRRYSHIFNGAQTFEQLFEESTVLLDRSLFLSELFRQHTRVIMVCVPMGVGKTMLLTMAHAFFAHQPNRFHSENYAMFSEKFEEGRQFKIMANEQFVQDHFGVYPTMYVSLKGVSGDCKQMEHQIGFKIQHLFHQHEDLLLTTNAHLLNSAEKKRIEHFVENVPTNIEWPCVLRLLTKALSKCHKKNVIVLVDDYDAPLMYERNNFDASGNWRNAISLVRDFIDALEQASNVRLLLVFGNHRFHSSSSQLRVHSADSDCAEQQGSLLHFFGLSSDEFDALCACHRLDNRLVDEAKRFYNGFNLSSVPMCSTYSVMRLLNDWLVLGKAKFVSHFRQSEFMQHLRPMYRDENIKRKLEQLLETGTETSTVTINNWHLDVPLREDDLENLLRVAESLRNPAVGPPDAGEALQAEYTFLQLLLCSGYLCRRGNVLEVPNKELRQILKHNLEKHHFLFSQSPASSSSVANGAVAPTVDGSASKAPSTSSLKKLGKPVRKLVDTVRRSLSLNNSLRPSPVAPKDAGNEDAQQGSHS